MHTIGEVNRFLAITGMPLGKRIVGRAFNLLMGVLFGLELPGRSEEIVTTERAGFASGQVVDHVRSALRPYSLLRRERASIVNCLSRFSARPSSNPSIDLFHDAVIAATQ